MKQIFKFDLSWKYAIFVVIIPKWSIKTILLSFQKVSFSFQDDSFYSKTIIFKTIVLSPKQLFSFQNYGFSIFKNNPMTMLQPWPNGWAKLADFFLGNWWVPWWWWRLNLDLKKFALCFKWANCKFNPISFKGLGIHCFKPRILVLTFIIRRDHHWKIW